MQQCEVLNKDIDINTGNKSPKEKEQKIEIAPLLMHKQRVVAKSRAEPASLGVASELVLAKLHRMGKSTQSNSPLSNKKPSIFGELFALAKAKLESKSIYDPDTDVSNIFGKFEDRTGIANANEEEYKKNTLTKVDPNKHLSTDVSFAIPKPISTKPKPPPSPLFQVPPQPRDPSLGFIPNQPTTSLAATIKNNLTH